MNVSGSPIAPLLLSSSFLFGLEYAGPLRCSRCFCLFDLHAACRCVQRRSTDPEGNTTWIDSSLVTGAVEGRLVLLDGLDRLPADTLSSLSRLLADAEVALPDGSLLVTRSKLGGRPAAAGVRLIHPSFRVLGLALPPSPRANWMTAESACMFKYHMLPPLAFNDQAAMLEALFPAARENEVVTSLLGMVREAEAMSRDETSRMDSPLSLRQLLRLTRIALHYPADLYDAIWRTTLAPFLPQPVKDALAKLLTKHGIDRPFAVDDKPLDVVVNTAQSQLEIGGVSYPIRKPTSPALVPHVLFFEIPRHVLHMRDVLKDLAVGEKHLLLIGNQGVGKNKIADRMMELLGNASFAPPSLPARAPCCIACCEQATRHRARCCWLAGMEREYMQLHRDTTVQTLTLAPSLQAGRVVWEDSALVRACQFGRVLVLDEVDKAPLEVVCILKGLVEDGEMQLADGRRIVSGSGGSAARTRDDIEIHADFRLIVLANRPGYPFLGNDFFRETGDIFSCHVIDNPDRDSELALLRAYSLALSSRASISMLSLPCSALLPILTVPLASARAH